MLLAAIPNLWHAIDATTSQNWQIASNPQAEKTFREALADAIIDMWSQGVGLTNIRRTAMASQRLHFDHVADDDDAGRLYLVRVEIGPTDVRSFYVKEAAHTYLFVHKTDAMEIIRLYNLYAEEVQAGI